jgi:hypothetical protein
VVTHRVRTTHLHRGWICGDVLRVTNRRDGIRACYSRRVQALRSCEQAKLFSAVDCGTRGLPRRRITDVRRSRKQVQTERFPASAADSGIVENFVAWLERVLRVSSPGAGQKVHLGRTNLRRLHLRLATVSIA